MDWLLIFSDGTGQRGVRDDTGNQNTNIFHMFLAVDGLPGFSAFYDAGLGAPPGTEEMEQPEPGWSRTFRNLWSKATGWGITANIVDCHDAVLARWRPGMKIGLFGFSRGAYTVRCLGGVIGACGIATRSGDGKAISTQKDDATRRKIAEEAVAIYKLDPKTEKTEREARSTDFRRKYAAADVVPDVVGVFDTVKALGLPGVTEVVNPYKHVFHDNVLNRRVPVGLQAFSIDENRKVFAAVPWADSEFPGQTIEQCWFPGVHSDIGGGYGDDRRLADVPLAWMLERLATLAGLRIPMTVETAGKLLGKQHDERTGFGKFWIEGTRDIRDESHDVDPLCPDIEHRYDGGPPSYRPGNLRRHPRVKGYY